MKNRIASLCWRSTSVGLVLLSLAACAGAPRVVTKTVTVEVPVPVVQRLAPELLRECTARVVYPAGSLTVGAIVDRLEAVEDALAICANQVAVIAAGQAPPR